MIEVVRALRYWLDEHAIDTDGVTLTVSFPHDRERYNAGMQLKRNLEPYQVVPLHGQTVDGITLEGIRIQFVSR